MYKLFKKLTITILCVCFLNTVSAQVIQDSDVLFWTKDHRLTFADFQGKPAKEDTALHGAPGNILTHKLGSITKSIDVRVMPERGKTMFTIRAGIKKKLSWIKNDGDTLSLKHEQGHFDICEIYARILRRDIREAKSLSQAKEMFNRVSSEEEMEQDNYDKENKFPAGGITTEWKQKISNHLKELEQYISPGVTLMIDK